MPGAQLKAAAPLAQPGEWVEHAACKGQTDRMVMPERHKKGKYSAPNTKRIEAARTVCRGCPVIGDCLAWALTSPDPSCALMAGGLTFEERARHRREKGLPNKSPLFSVQLFERTTSDKPKHCQRAGGMRRKAYETEEEALAMRPGYTFYQCADCGQWHQTVVYA